MTDTDESSSRKKEGAKARLSDVLLISWISMLGPLASNMYQPAFGELETYFGISHATVTQTLTVYLVTFAISSLFVGAISDRFGRKPVILWCTCMLAFASVMLATTESIGAFFFWRIVQGTAACAGPVLTQAIVRDRWSGSTATKMLALMTLLFALAPAFSPVIGGAVTIAWGWRGVFWTVAAINAALAITVFFRFTETLPKAMRSHGNVSAIFKSYGPLFKHKAYMAGVFGNAFTFMGGILFAAGAADFVTKVMHMGVGDFGYLTIPLIACGMLGSAVLSRCATHFETTALLKVGLTGTMTAGVIGVLLSLWDPLYPLVLVAPCLYQMAMSWSRPVMTSINLDYFPKTRGAAASVQQFFQTSAFAVCTMLWVPLVLGRFTGYTLVMTFCALASITCWLVALHLRRKMRLQDGAQAPAAAVGGVAQAH